MARALPANLEMLYEAFGQDRISALFPGDEFEVDGVTFVCTYQPGSSADRFYIVKSLALAHRYREIAAQFHGGRIVELGIAEGGSTALLALDADPEVLLAVDLESEPLEALDEFIAQRGLGDRILPRWGVDQADRAQLSKLADEAFGRQPIDLVLDDCSHVLAPTRASFEVLFPRLRPGGLYLIEDWNADHAWQQSVKDAVRLELAAGNAELEQEIRASLAAPPPAEAPPRHEPLYQLAVELMLVRAGSGDLVAEVSVDEHWITVRRGPGEVDPDSFRLDDAYTDFFGLKGW